MRNAMVPHDGGDLPDHRSLNAWERLGTTLLSILVVPVVLPFFMYAEEVVRAGMSARPAWIFFSDAVFVSVFMLMCAVAACAFVINLLVGPLVLAFCIYLFLQLIAYAVLLDSAGYFCVEYKNQVEAALAQLVPVLAAPSAAMSTYTMICGRTWWGPARFPGSVSIVVATAMVGIAAYIYFQQRAGSAQCPVMFGSIDE